MRPLTDTCPKPALVVQGKPLLHWHLDSLACSGVRQIVCNTAWLADRVVECAQRFVPDLHSRLDSRFGTGTPIFPGLVFSHEGQDFGHALETAGGICRALPLLCLPEHPDDVFWVLAADVYAPDFVFAAEAVARFARSGLLAQLWLVPNPPHHPEGDFGIDGNLATHAQPRYTYSSLGLFRSSLFAPPWCDIPPGNPAGLSLKLVDVLRCAIDAGRIGATLYHGNWCDVGTPQRLAALGASPISDCIPACIPD